MIHPNTCENVYSPWLDRYIGEACARMVSMSVPELGVTGLPQVKCGAPIPRDRCPFSHDRHTGCPFA